MVFRYLWKMPAYSASLSSLRLAADASSKLSRATTTAEAADGRRLSTLFLMLISLQRRPADLPGDVDRLDGHLEQGAGTARAGRRLRRRLMLTQLHHHLQHTHGNDQLLFSIFIDAVFNICFAGKIIIFHPKKLKSEK